MDPTSVNKPADRLTLSVEDFDIDVLTGIYSEETHLPQPLRISVHADLALPDAFAPDTPLNASKSYMDLKAAIESVAVTGVHYMLVESVADHIAAALFAEDAKVLSVTVRIIKLAIAEGDESIGITMTRHRRG